MSVEQLILTLVQLLFWGGIVFLSMLGFWYKKKHSMNAKEEMTHSKKFHI